MRNSLLAAVVGVVMLPAAAGATAYNSLGDFSFNGFSQGLRACSFSSGCVDVAADRTGLAKAFDGSLGSSSFHSLGAYGFASFGVAPGENITSLTTSETTFGNNGGPGWPEKVGLFFSNTVIAAGIATWSADILADIGSTFTNPVITAYGGGLGAGRAAVDGSDLADLLRDNVLGADAALGAVFSNDLAAGFDIAGNTAAGVTVIGSNGGTNGWNYQIDIDTSVFGSYRYLTLVDLTMSDTPTFWQSRRGDGWDLAELRVTGALSGPDLQVSVPSPASLALLGIAVVGLGAARRRRS